MSDQPADPKNLTKEQWDEWKTPYVPTVQESTLRLQSTPSWQSAASDLRSRIRAAYLPLIALLQEAEDAGFAVICSISRDQTNRIRQIDDDIKIFRYF